MPPGARAPRIVTADRPGILANLKGLWAGTWHPEGMYDVLCSDVRIKLKNAGQNMPFNEMGGTPWTVQVTPGTGVSADGGTGGLQTFRIALQAAQEISMDVMPVALPCGKESQIEVRIDRENVILESNKTNNRAVFMIAGNRCQDA